MASLVSDLENAIAECRATMLNGLVSLEALYKAKHDAIGDAHSDAITAQTTLRKTAEAGHKTACERVAAAEARAKAAEAKLAEANAKIAALMASSPAPAEGAG